MSGLMGFILAGWIAVGLLVAYGSGSPALGGAAGAHGARRGVASRGTMAAHGRLDLDPSGALRYLRPPRWLALCRSSLPQRPC